MARALGNFKTAAVLGYVALVLGVDTLAAYGVHWGIAWHAFRWQTSGGVDLFKLLFWFVIPFLWSLKGMDWGYLGVARWRRVDAYLLLAMVAMGGLAVLAIPLFPSLRSIYSGMGHAPAAAKWAFALSNLAWTLSWLVGWEFMHRYLLLRAVSERWLRYGWLLVPLFEGVYHLQKPLVEAFGMVVFSLLATQWTLRRRNILLPFIAHLFIEMALTAFILLS